MYLMVTETYSFHEYLHGQLSEPLIAGSTYYCEFYIKPRFDGGFINKYEMIVTPEPIDSTLPSDGVLNMEPTIEYVGDIITDTTQYTKISGCFTAQGGERYITLGNFNADQETDFIWDPNTALERSNYSYFDDVGVFKFSFEHLLSFDTIICAGSCINIANRIGGDYNWQFAGASPSTSQEIAPQQICYDEPGVFDIEVVMAHCAGQDTLLLEGAVTVVPQPTLTADTLQQLQVTAGDTVPLQACAEGDTYQWQPAQELSCTDCPNPSATLQEDVTYTVQVLNAGQCAQSCTYEVEVFEQPDPSFALSQDTICSGQCATVEYTGTNSDIGLACWSFESAAPAQASGLEPQAICFDQPGQYEISLQVGTALDTLTAVDTIVVLLQPEASVPAAEPYRLQFGEHLRLSACADGQFYAWQSNYPLSCRNCPNPELEAIGNDTLQLLVSNGGNCAVACRYFVEVEVPDNIYLPTAFSPNDDGRNDFFEPLGPYHEPLRLEVYDRWGGLLYKGEGIAARWDGISGGEPATAGLYTYQLLYRDVRDGLVKKVSGGVMLLR
ncbi:MAG: gliding motility-associated C-terminal domain-containing protein [bacterium]|nr:gliding motility-associated C-terminal domain-containing protein [bacterium]